MSETRAARYRITTDPEALLRSMRYRVTTDPAADLLRPYVIADELMGGAFCALPDASGTLKRLTFRNGKSAREWLDACQGAS